MEEVLKKSFNFEKRTFKYFFAKYQTNELLYYHNIIDNIIFNERTHLVSLFKDYLILDDNYEFLRRFYTKEESYPRLKKTVTYYDLHENIYPNYSPLPESKLIFRNIIKKQNLYDIKKERERKNESENQHINKDDNIIFNASAYNYIINQSNSVLSIFDIEKNNNGDDESINGINNLINTINKDENKIIINNIGSSRPNYNDNRLNLKDVENKQLISSKIYKKNVSLIKQKNNILNINKIQNFNQNTKITNEDKIINNQLKQNIINEINAKNEYIPKTSERTKQRDIKNQMYNNTNNNHDIFEDENNNVNFSKIVKNNLNYFTNKNNTNYKSSLPHSINRVKHINKYLYTKNSISQKNNNNRIYQNKNLSLSKSISESNFHNRELHSFNKSITPNRQVDSFYFGFKNNNCLKNSILRQNTENIDLNNNLLIQEHFLTEEIPKIKVNMKPQKTYNKLDKKYKKLNNQYLLIEVNNFADYKSQKTFESELNFPITDKNIFNKNNDVPYRKKYTNKNNNYNKMNSKTYNDTISAVIYLQNPIDNFPKLANGHYNTINQISNCSYIKPTNSYINSENNYTIKKNYNTIIPTLNEVPYEKKKITKNKSFNTISNNKIENNNTCNNTIDSIKNKIINENNSFRHPTNCISFAYKNTKQNKIKRNHYPIRLNEINFHNSVINKNAINRNENDIDIFNNIMNRDSFLKINDNQNNYNDYKYNNSVVEKNKTYINININNNIGIDNSNYRNNPKILNKTMNQKLKHNITFNRNSLLGTKINKVKEWKNRKIIDIIRESKLKYLKIKSSNNTENKSEKKNKLVNENINSIKSCRNRNKKNNKIIKTPQYMSSNDIVENKNKFKFK